MTLDGSISYTFLTEGMHTVTVQVAVANTILQDTKTVAVKGQQSLLVAKEHSVGRCKKKPGEAVVAISASAECDAIWSEVLSPQVSVRCDDL